MMSAIGSHSEAVTRVAGRVRELAEGYEPPRFAHVPSPDAALFLSAIDHRTGYRGRYLVGGKGPYEGSALLWALACAEEARRPGSLTAERISRIGPDEVAALFRIGGETVADPEGRARLWRDLADGILRDHGGEAEALIGAADGQLGGSGGLLALLGIYEAFADPLQKKSFLFAKICERRGWLRASDPECWEVCSDNVLMRLALRSGLVHPGSLDEVRPATRRVFKDVADEAGVPPQILDDLLWEVGGENPDLLGTEGGDLREPQRDPASHWY